MSLDPDLLVGQRRARIDETLRSMGVPALLTSDPFSIRYTTGTRNMLVHGLTGPDRLALVVAGGPAVLWEFAGCEHLVEAASFVDQIREAPGLNAKKSANHKQEAAKFADDVVELFRRHVGESGALAVEGIDLSLTDNLRAGGLALGDGVAVMQKAMSVKQPAEIAAMTTAVHITEAATAHMEAAIAPGATEQEVWSEFYRSLIAEGGELVVARLLQAGERTFPYFQEASAHMMADGDLVCFDSDAVAVGGYSVDFSRTFLCGDSNATETQRWLYALALEQLEHNAANLAAGRSFEDFARRAFDVPEPYARYGYYQLAHGLGLAGGHPNIPRSGPEPYPLPGEIEPGMVLCVESYVGDPVTRQGVKLENQYLVHDDTVEQMSTYPLDQRLTS